MIVLLGFGLVHFYFIWCGDILALYAMCGMLLYFFRNQQPALADPLGDRPDLAVDHLFSARSA